VSCTTRKAPSSSPQPPPGQAAADAKAEKKKQAADAKAEKEKEAADAKAVKAAAAEARKKKDLEAKQAAAAAKKEAAAAKAAKLHPATASSTNSTNAPGPVLNPNAPLTKEQKLNDLNSRYKNDELSSLEYQTERAKILAEP